MEGENQLLWFGGRLGSGYLELSYTRDECMLSPHLPCPLSCLGTPTARTSLCLSVLLWELGRNSSLRVSNELTHVSGKDQSLAVRKSSLVVMDAEHQSMAELRVRKVVGIGLIVKE